MVAMIKQHVIKELREMFLDGATPSRLMLHVQLNHPEEESLHFLIKDYFERTFHLPIVREVRPGDDYTMPNPDHAHFNRDLVHEMVCRLNEWYGENLEGTWLENIDELWTQSRVEHKERLKTAKIEELDRVWKDMTESERLFIIQRIAHKDYLWYKVKTLSRLVERLQQKIIELESHVDLESNKSP